MHFQCTHSPSPKIYSTSSRIHIWNPVGGLRWSCFSRGAPSMFDGILNAMLCLRRFPSLGLHKEILNSPCPLIFLIYVYSQSNHSRWSNFYHFLVHQRAATNSMHLQPNPPPCPAPPFKLTAPLSRICIWKQVGSLRWSAFAETVKVLSPLAVLAEGLHRWFLMEF